MPPIGGTANKNFSKAWADNTISGVNFGSTKMSTVDARSNAGFNTTAYSKTQKCSTPINGQKPGILNGSRNMRLDTAPD